MRLSRFYFQKDFGERGDCFVVLSGDRWNSYLRGRLGIVCEPFFERACLQHEPDTFPNGHPHGWVYRSGNELILDERRWLSEEQVKLLEEAVARVMESPLCERVQERQS